MFYQRYAASSWIYTFNAVGYKRDSYTMYLSVVVNN